MSETTWDAVVFDVDGTLAETERDGHRPAFNRAFADLGLPYRWGVAEYGELLAVTGGRQRLQAFLLARGHDRAEAEQLAAALHEAKTAHVVEWVRSGPVRPRPGVRDLLARLAGQGRRLAIATTGSRAWVDPLLARLLPDVEFEVVITGEDVTALKPAPDAYLRALDGLRLRADQALAVEDSAPGLAAARAAGLACLLVPSAYRPVESVPLDSATYVVDGFERVLTSGGLGLGLRHGRRAAG